MVEVITVFRELQLLTFHNMQEDYADIVARECGSSSAHSCSKQDSTRCQTGESKDSKRSLALSHAEVCFRWLFVQLDCIRRIFRIGTVRCAEGL